MSDDTSLADTPATPSLPVDPIALIKPKPLTVDEVLATARRIERTASICIRGDLQAEWDELLDELATLVTASGEVIEQDAEASMDEVTGAARAQQISARLSTLRAEMASAMWRVRFRGKPSDEWATFLKKHNPKGDNVDRTDFFNLLVAETAIEPEITVEQMQQLRRTLTGTSVAELVDTAWRACNEGGLDVPKLPRSLAKIAAGGSVT